MTDRVNSSLDLIRSLIARAPDKAVRELEAALGGDMGSSALSGVRSMVDDEVADRVMRDAVLAPFAPMFVLRKDGAEQLSFPKAAFANLWRAMKEGHPDETADAVAAALARSEDNPFPESFDVLCRLAAAGLRDRSTPAYAALADQLTAADPNACRQLVGCLELSHLARPAVARLGEWVKHMTEDRAASVRLAYKDAVQIADDGGPRLFEILYAHLNEPWMILRVITAIMVRPVDNYVSNSELAIFADRLMVDIERRIGLIRVFNLDGGHAAGEATGLDVRTVTAEIDEFEHSLNLKREGPWGARLIKAKGDLAKIIEGYLKKAPDILSLALPMAPVRIGGRIIRQSAKLDVPPDQKLIARAAAMLTLIEQVRGAAVNGGYNTLRLKTVEDLDSRLGVYTEDLLDALHNGMPNEIPNARLYIEDVADLMGRLRDDKAAQIIRRRAAAA